MDLESDWGWTVVREGFNLLGAHKAARVLTSTGPVYVLDTPDPVLGWAMLGQQIIPGAPPPVGVQYTFGFAPKPAGFGSRFPYGYTVPPDHPI